jgi:hypothetical protein
MHLLTVWACPVSDSRWFSTRGDEQQSWNSAQPVALSVCLHSYSGTGDTTQHYLYAT